MPTHLRRSQILLAVIAVFCAAAVLGLALMRTPREGTCPLRSLPPAVGQTARTIQSGGPYPFPGKDNTHFGNYENHLPKRDSDYYREYTVATQDQRHRGEQRIVTGGGTEHDPQVWYYTADHYEHFCEIPDAES